MAETAITVHLDNLHCGSCVARADQALKSSADVSEVSVNLADETARFRAARPQAIKAAIEALERAGYPARTSIATLEVGGMSCASCLGRVERALAAVPGVLEVSVNLAAERASLRYLDGAVTPAALAAISTNAGYPARPLHLGTGGGTGVDKEAAASRLLRRVGLAGILTLPVFVLEMGSHVIPGMHMMIADTIGLQASWIIQFVLTTIVLFGPGLQFFTLGIPALLRRAPDMNSLVAVGTGAAWCYSVMATFFPALLPETLRAVYFEAAAVIVVLILLGRWLEARAKGRTGAAIRALVGLRPRTARVLRDGTAEDVEVDRLAVGDLVLLRPGERVPADGEVAEGSAAVDESMITGEPVPVAKAAGAALTGGTVLTTGSVTLRTTRVGADTTLSQIIRMVEEAQGAKLPIQDLVNRVTLWFVPAVMGIAVLTVIVWLVFGPPDDAVTMALVAGVSVLIIACPCAMGLATPTSIMVGTGRAAELGVLFRRGDALQSLSGVDVIALDKTGTVTEGRPKLTGLELSPGFASDEVLSAIAAVEARSEHPLAAAILRAADGLDLPHVAGFRAVAGQGVAGEVAGRAILVGNESFLESAGVPTGPHQARARVLSEGGSTVFFAAIGGRVAALVVLSDPIKPEAARAIAALRARGIDVAMITGDRAETAHAVADAAGISHVVAGVLPEGKVAAIDDLRRGGRRVAFVGDGINDAPALAHADVGIAIGTGTDVAIESADVVLMSGDLGGVVNALHVSKHTMRNIVQNLVWAFGYNAALIPVAAGALYPLFGLLLSPVFAAGAMALSSVSVLTNALRLRRLRSVIEAAGEGAGSSPARPVRGSKEARA